MLSCNHIALSRGESRILQNFSCNFKSGSCTVISGKNGSGKTSILRMLAGFTSPDSGQILWQNEDIYKTPEYYMPNVRFISHNAGVDNRLLVREQLQFWAQIRQTAAVNVKRATTYYGINDYLEMQISYLSQGWKKRLLLTYFLLDPAPIWLLDEPFAHLDNTAVSQLKKAMKAHIEVGGILIATAVEGDIFSLPNLVVRKINLSSHTRKAA